jgi:DEAD/DEAH box helicase domain-containing protein
MFRRPKIANFQLLIGGNLNSSDIINEIKSLKNYKKQIVHVETFPSRKAETKSIELKSDIWIALSEKEINELYRHQAEAIEHLRIGENVVLSTSTASGKSLAYVIPIFEKILTEPQSRALYIAPLKALTNDQLRTFSEFRDNMWQDIPINISEYTGDTPKEDRIYIRNNCQIILSNPDMLHTTILRNHHLWKKFISNLKYIVLDESHSYRGLFGSNVANLIRRFNRICEHYGSSPQYICCTATIGNPAKHSSTLIGKDVKLIAKDASSSGLKQFIFWNPPLNHSSLTDVIELFTYFIQKGARTIIFTKSRRETDYIYKFARKKLNERRCDAKISSYRSGYTSERRKKIEHDLSNGTLQGVISTNALELGIDIGGLDVCILHGYPGTVMSTFQRAGRVGRAKNDSMVVMVAGSDALDQYYMRNPKDFFNKNAEDAVLNVYNKNVSELHLQCAEVEKKLTENDVLYFGQYYFETWNSLKEKGLLEDLSLKKDTDLDVYNQISIRNTNRENYSIVCKQGQKINVIENSIEKSQAFRQCFEGAVYGHIDEDYLVTEIDHSTREIYVQEHAGDYFTKPKINFNISITNLQHQHNLISCPDIKIGFGKICVEEQVVGYKKIKYFSEEELGEESVSMPPYLLDTEAVWLDIPHRFKKMAEDHNFDFDGGINAIGQALVSVYPINLLVDSNDIGGVSISEHAGLQNNGAIFVYDMYSGGVGYAKGGCKKIFDLLHSTLNLIEKCPCEKGCPSCIQSQKYGNNNDSLDKNAAIIMLHEMLKLPNSVPNIGTKSTHTKVLEERKTANDWILLGKEQKYNPTKAYEFFENALLLEPKNPDALLNKGLAAYKCEKYVIAVECFDKMIDYGYNRPGVWRYKLIALYYARNYRRYVATYNECITHEDPNIKKLILNDQLLKKYLQEALVNVNF